MFAWVLIARRIWAPMQEPDFHRHPSPPLPHSGTTDNKGPIMAMIHAIYELIEQGVRGGRVGGWVMDWGPGTGRCRCREGGGGGGAGGGVRVREGCVHGGEGVMVVGIWGMLGVAAQGNGWRRGGVGKRNEPTSTTPTESLPCHQPPRPPYTYT